MVVPFAEPPTLPDSAESSLKTDQSLHLGWNKFENLLDYDNFFPVFYVERTP